MERYCSTGQSPQRAVAPTEEEVIQTFKGVDYLSTEAFCVSRNVTFLYYLSFNVSV